MNFAVIDVETANRKRNSICQIGIVVVRNREIVTRASFYLNPIDPFDEFNIRIHKIDAEKVKNSPIFPDIYPRIEKAMSDVPVVHHSAFDPSAIRNTAERHGLTARELTWVDSIGIAKSVWPQFKSYKLKKLCKYFDIDFKHHDAVEDAEATAKLVMIALNESKTTIKDWV